MEKEQAPIKKIVLPLPHYQVRLVRANTTYLIANRGGFKTTRGISLYVIDCVYEMPGSTGVILGPSFEHLGDNTLNPLFHALNEFGFQQGKHYVIGERPPKEWPKPFIKVEANKYDHIISWHNGTNQYLISMSKKASANGISAQWGVFDEIKLMDEKELNAVTFPIFRGNEDKFQGSPLFMSKFYATDKLADPAHIKWILKKRLKNNPKKVAVIITLQMGLDDLKREYAASGITKRKRMQAGIAKIESKLVKLRQNLSFYVEANHLDTVQILGEKWLADKKANMKDYEFRVAIKNEDPDKPEEGFYPDFDINIHGHETMEDYDTKQPLIIACDYQHSVSPIVVVQLGTLPGQVQQSVNYIKEIYTLAPEGLEAAVQQFCDYYKAHHRKLVYYVYDQTATGKRNDALEYYRIVVAKLKKNGWMVTKMYTGAAPAHFNKYTDTKKWLLNEKNDSKDIRINRVRCPKLIISITSAPAKMLRGKTEKDKSSEQNSNLDQSETTHFSDCFDMINHCVLSRAMITSTMNHLVGGTAFR